MRGLIFNWLMIPWDISGFTKFTKIFWIPFLGLEREVILELVGYIPSCTLNKGPTIKSFGPLPESFGSPRLT